MENLFWIFFVIFFAASLTSWRSNPASPLSTPTPTPINNQPTTSPSPDTPTPSPGGTNTPTPTLGGTNTPTPSPTTGLLPHKLIFGINPSLARWYSPIKPDTWEENMVSKIQEACGASMRTGFDWAQIEPDPPISGVHTYHWDNFDRIVNSTTSKNIDIIALIVTTPLWASDNSDPDNVHLYPPNNAHRADYIAFLTALVNRYQGKVKYYEFWNEANGCGWHPGCGGDKQAKAQEYLPWQKVTYDTIKNIDSSLSVSTTGMDGADADFLTRLYNLSSTVTCAGHFCWDAVNTHPYNPNGPINFNGLDALHSLMHTNNDNSPVWITEYGWNMSDDTTKASYLRQTLERLNTPNYSYIPIATYLVIADTPQTGEYGLLRDNLTPKSSSFNTFKSLACGE